MKKLIAAAGIGAALIAGPLAGAGTASATTNEYLSFVQQELPYVMSQYGGPAIGAMGNKICGWEAQGYTGASELADLIIAQMPMSRSAAISLQVYAENFLGC